MVSDYYIINNLSRQDIESTEVLLFIIIRATRELNSVSSLPVGRQVGERLEQ